MTRTHAALLLFGFALGVLVYDTALERKIEQPRQVRYCAPADAAGRALAASMVSSAAGTPSQHECYYR